jgi:hypothetical protein
VLLSLELADLKLNPDRKVEMVAGSHGYKDDRSDSGCA